MGSISVNIDGREYRTYSGHTIPEVASQKGVYIPTLCHDDKLENCGSCGICVIEVEGNPRLVRSCSTEIVGGMVIQTQSDLIRENRKATLELN